ncbi:MAG: catalase-related domain-containing protein, partial [Christiangramia sp.]
PGIFYRSLKDWEKDHVANAYSFELGKCTQDHIKERMLWLINKIDKDLSKKVADNLGMKIPSKIEKPVNQAIGADDDGNKNEPKERKDYIEKSDALSQSHIKTESIATRKIAFLVGDGFDADNVSTMKTALEKKNAVVNLVATHGGKVKCTKGEMHKVDAALMTTESVAFDAIYIPGGAKSIKALKDVAKAKKFINESLKHCKPIAIDAEGEQLFDDTYGKDFKDDEAVCINKKPADFIKAIAMHRNWKREEKAKMIPA